MNDTSPVRSRWRFSLRELLLVVVAVAAVLGWLRATFWREPFRSTPLATTLDLGKEIDDARVESGETTWSGLTGGASDRGNAQTVEKSLHFRFPLAAKHLDPFAERLTHRLKNRIGESGCEVHSVSVSSSGDDLHEVHYGYRQGATVGSVRIVVLHDGDQQGRVLFYLHEHLDSR